MENKEVTDVLGLIEFMNNAVQKYYSGEIDTKMFSKLVYWTQTMTSVVKNASDQNEMKELKKELKVIQKELDSQTKKVRR